MKTEHPALTTMTPDEINDLISNQVESEMPRPRGGFSSADEEDEHRRAQEARFLELVEHPSLWNF